MVVLLSYGVVDSRGPQTPMTAAYGINLLGLQDREGTISTSANSFRVTCLVIGSNLL